MRLGRPALALLESMSIAEQALEACGGESGATGACGAGSSAGGFALILLRTGRGRQQQRRNSQGWQIELRCLTPAPALSQLSSMARSIVMASGTLGDMQGLQDRMGLPFPVRVSAPHPADAGSQLMAMAFRRGPTGGPLELRHSHD